MTGYRPLPTSDPKEAQLRAEWYEAKERGGTAFQLADAALSRYLWDRTEADIAEDRRKHPKAKRNQPVPEGIAVGEGRTLP